MLMHVNFFKALLEDTPKPLTCPNIRPFPYPHISMVLGFLPVVIKKIIDIKNDLILQSYQRKLESNIIIVIISNWKKWKYG